MASAPAKWPEKKGPAIFPVEAPRGFAQRPKKPNRMKPAGLKEGPRASRRSLVPGFIIYLKMHHRETSYPNSRNQPDHENGSLTLNCQRDAFCFNQTNRDIQGYLWVVDRQPPNCLLCGAGRVVGVVGVACAGGTIHLWIGFVFGSCSVLKSSVPAC